MDQIQLINLLKSNNLINPKKAKTVLSIHEKTGKGVGRILFEKRYLNEKKLYKYIQKEYGINQEEFKNSGPNYDILGITLPKFGVSGDFFGFFPLEDGKVAVTLSDVSGKGLEAGLLALVLSNMLRDMKMGSIIPSMIMKQINQVSIDFFTDMQFATFIVLILDTYSGTVEFCGAGSPPILVYRYKKNQIEEIHPKGIPVGIEHDYVFSQSRFELEKGDTILMFTDGAYECQNWSKEFYGMKRIHEVYLAHARLPLKKLLKKFISQLRWFTFFKSRNDDTTYVAIQRRRIKKKRVRK